MKRLEDFTREDLEKFRKDIILNSLFVSDYQNSLGITTDIACLFFDSFMSFIENIAEEEGFHLTDKNWKEFLEKYDTLDNLEAWLGCYEDFSWVEYEVEEYEYELAA